MNIYPAVDILNGQAVRLRQGRRDAVTVYGDPVEMASRWAAAGAAWLHVVDLDGAFEGSSRNLGILRSITTWIPGLQVQTGGGIRDIPALEACLSAGVKRVIIGTAAVHDRKFVDEALSKYPGHVAAGIDARDGLVRTAGWVEDSGVRATDLALELYRSGIRKIVYTDISRDGEMTGPNVDASVRLAEKSGADVIVSGGVSALEDIIRIRKLNHPRVDGVIIGKALYEGRIQLEEALAHAR